MSGLIRNLLTLLRALLPARRLDRGRTDDRFNAHFTITPFDCGLRVLKSDKYLQLAEAAQLDYLLRTGLLRTLLARRIGFINAAQLIKFTRPIPMFARVRVETAVAFADSRCAYFSHAFSCGGQSHGEVLVKMKFKQGALTIPPRDLITQAFEGKPAHLERWDSALEAM